MAVSHSMVMVSGFSGEKEREGERPYDMLLNPWLHATLVNLMLAQQMMNKGQMPAGLTPQQQQQHQQQVRKKILT